MRDKNLDDNESLIGFWLQQKSSALNDFECQFTALSGATENAGRENGGPAKSRGVKMQDVKMTDQIAGHEIAGH